MNTYLKTLLFLFLLPTLGACSTARETPRETQDKETGEQVERPVVSEEEQLQSTAMLMEGIKQKLLGNPQRAVSLFYDAKEKDPRNDAAYYELAKMHARQNQLKDAARYADVSIELDPGNKEYLLLRADIWILDGHMPEAIRIYEELTAKHPRNMMLHRNLVSAYRHEEQYDEALQVVKHIESVQGLTQESGMEKLELLIRMGRYQDAIDETLALIDLYPEEPGFVELLGDLYLETGQEEKAKETYLQMLERDPGNYMARLLLADYYHQQDKSTEAFEQLKQAFQSPRLGLEGKARIVFTYMSWAEEDPIFMEQAIELADIMLSMHDDEAETWLVYGDLLFHADKKEEARDKYIKAAELDPSGLSVWQQILSLDLQLGDYEAMLRHSDLALEYFFEQPILFLFNGLASLQLEDYEGAASSLEYGLAISVNDDDLREDFITMLADTYYYLDAHDESDRFYQKALEKNPDNATALNNYSYHLALRKERLDEALEMSGRALELQPENAAFLDTHGWILYQKGEYQEASTWIKKAIEASDEPNATILEHYGDVMYKIGNKEEALNYWHQAQKAGNGSDYLDKKIEDGTLYE